MIIFLLILSTGLKCMHPHATWEDPILSEHNPHCFYDLGWLFELDKKSNLCNHEPNAAATVTGWQWLVRQFYKQAHWYFHTVKSSANWNQVCRHILFPVLVKKCISTMAKTAVWWRYGRIYCIMRIFFSRNPKSAQLTFLSSYLLHCGCCWVVFKGSNISTDTTD